ncbi:MAG: hypothetical protein IPF68_11760 [Bacteroidales bacterium]|nr:hypothetical protein [Bacteroidales bacterium]
MAAVFLAVNENIPDLTPFGWNDRVGSLKLSSTPLTGVQLFENPDYGGDCGFETDIPDLDIGTIDFADVASSVKLVNIPGAKLYDFNNYGGGVIFVDQNIVDLTPLGWNDRIGSLKISSSPLTGIELFEHPNYQGDSRFFETDIPDLDLGTIDFADVASSVRIHNLNEAKLFDGNNYGGDNLTVTQDIPDLTPLGWNDRVGSLKIINKKINSV